VSPVQSSAFLLLWNESRLGRNREKHFDSLWTHISIDSESCLPQDAWDWRGVPLRRALGAVADSEGDGRAGVCLSQGAEGDAGRGVAEGEAGVVDRCAAPPHFP
jgi:hypothetical protein